jgi:UDP-glucose 4-epimerase
VRLATSSSDLAREYLGYKPNPDNYCLALEEMIDWIKYKGVREFEYHLELEICNDNCPETWVKQYF